MEALWINTFCNTTIEVFRTMFSIEAKPGTPRLKGTPYPTADITGIIGFSGEAQGSISLSFPESTALKLVLFLSRDPAGATPARATCYTRLLVEDTASTAATGHRA